MRYKDGPSLVILTTGGGAKSWQGRLAKTTKQRKYLFDGCDDWEVPANLPEWDSHPSAIKVTRIGPDIVIHSSSTQQLFMVKLNNSIRKQDGRGPYLQKRKIPKPYQKARRYLLQN